MPGPLYRSSCLNQCLNILGTYAKHSCSLGCRQRPCIQHAPSKVDHCVSNTMPSYGVIGWASLLFLCSRALGGAHSVPLRTKPSGQFSIGFSLDDTGSQDSVSDHTATQAARPGKRSDDFLNELQSCRWVDVELLQFWRGQQKRACDIVAEPLGSTFGSKTADAGLPQEQMRHFVQQCERPCRWAVPVIDNHKRHNIVPLLQTLETFPLR